MYYSYVESDAIGILIWAIIVTITLGILTILVIRIRQKHGQDVQLMKDSIKQERKDAVDRSRNSLKGILGEQMSPLLPEFYSKYEPSDARFLGSPIDYVIFKNMSKFDKKTKDEENPIEIVLLDVKTGKSAKLDDLQISIKNAIDSGRISFDVIKPNIENQD